ncbi:MAG: TraR/DksA family transcriptional regulator [Planctomycetota bacterium]
MAEQRRTPYSEEELEEFRQLLLAKRRELVGDIEDLRDEAADENRPMRTGGESDTPTHTGDWATENREHEITHEMMQWERDLDREIEEALRRIEEGTYGVCLATGKPIDKQRLQAKPWAKFAKDYKQEEESEQRRLRPRPPEQR